MSSHKPKEAAMGKSFKLRVCRIITTTFQSCRSKDPSTLPHDPLPSSSVWPSSVNPKLLTAIDHHPSKNATAHCAVKPHVVSASILPGVPKNSVDDRSRHEFRWRQEEKWHVMVAKVYQQNQKSRGRINNSPACASFDSDEDGLSAFPPLPLPPPAAQRKYRRGRIKKIPTRFRMSTSSAESGVFSNEGEDDESLETETLVSPSRCVSTDFSSELNPPHSETFREKTLVLSRGRHHQKKVLKKQLKRGVSRGRVYRRATPSSASENEWSSQSSPPRLSLFKKLIPCSVEGKVKESFAVVKKSEDPYEDFKRSMMEMILEKQMFEERDLEQMLQCFLSLNSRDYHGLIIQVFVEIWEDMFSAAGSN